MTRLNFKLSYPVRYLDHLKSGFFESAPRGLLIDNHVRIAAQSFLRRPVHPRQSGLLIRLAVSDHIGDSLGGEVDDGHAVAVEAGEDVLIWLVGDRTDVRLEVGCVAHYFVEGNVSLGIEKGTLRELLR